MTSALGTEITQLLRRSIHRFCVSDAIYDRLRSNALTRDEDIFSHFCVYFAAFDPARKLYFLGRHIKSSLWLFNGGHVDLGEDLKTAVQREMAEEWGVDCVMPVPQPALISRTDIANRNVRCLEHYNIWYFIPVDQETFHPNPALLAIEFFENKWLAANEALAVVTDPPTRWVIEHLEKVMLASEE